jgi:hypothetical protein
MYFIIFMLQVISPHRVLVAEFWALDTGQTSARRVARRRLKERGRRRKLPEPTSARPVMAH